MTNEKRRRGETEYNLAKQALERDELLDFFIGNDPYAFLPRWTAAPGKTDLGQLLQMGLFAIVTENAYNKDLATQISKALIALTEIYDGLNPCATFLLIHALYSNPKYDMLPLDLDIEGISAKLEEAIRKNKLELIADKGPLSQGCEKGLYQSLAVLSVGTQECGGFSFFPEEDMLMFPSMREGGD